MVGSVKSGRAVVLALVVCLVLGGATLALLGRHQSTRDARPASSGVSPHAASSPATSPAPAPSTPVPLASTPAGDKALSSSVIARQAELRRLAKQAQALSSKRRNVRPVADFTIANFNIQGASHRGGISGRTSRVRTLLESYGVDVVALQEFQPPQRGIFSRIAGGTFEVFPGAAGRSLDAENSVAWRRATFELVRAETRSYRYFRGATRNMPRVLLRHRRTGVTVWVTSYHNPATCCGYGNSAGFRAQDVRAQAADANALVAATKTPLIVSGDMNDRASYFCGMAGGTGMHSADGGVVSGGCRPPRHAWIDWILGTPNVEFSGYLRDGSRFVRATSDHPIVVTRVKVTGKPGEGRH
ncbi:MAG: endonuclease/exonuclease/phosphatase family protein [Actinomycetota bacterium]|nr:endonuclease/exonuclease/phosphatase family protein [Actinomycetota bacterium]